MLDSRHRPWSVHSQDLLPGDIIRVRTRRGAHEHLYRVLTRTARTLTLADHDDPTIHTRKSAVRLDLTNPHLMARPIGAQPTSSKIARDLLAEHPATRALRPQIARAAHHHRHGNTRAEHDHVWVCLHDLTRIFLHHDTITRRAVVDHFTERIAEHYPYRSPLLVSFVESSQHLLLRALRPA